MQLHDAPKDIPGISGMPAGHSIDFFIRQVDKDFQVDLAK